jgi:nicotinamidase/pyrazinamidase
MSAQTRASFVPGAGDALVVVDVQRDFLPGGALGVARGDEVVAPLNDLLEAFARAGLPIFATRDWHPPDHCSFASRGGPWPPHCIAGSAGAAFPDSLVLPASAVVISKATGRDAEALSGFAGTELGARLAAAGVRRLVVGGLATDYCVLATVLDARAAGFEVLVPVAAVRAVERAAGDGARALERMERAGAKLLPASA